MGGFLPIGRIYASDVHIEASPRLFRRPLAATCAVSQMFNYSRRISFAQEKL